MTPSLGNFISVAAVMLSLSCAPPEDTVIEVQPTKALFKANDGVANGRMTAAEITEPLYPVTVPSFPGSTLGYDIMFTAMFRGWMRPFGPTDPDREPDRGTLAFFTALDDEMSFPTAQFTDFFQFDPTFPQQMTWQPHGSYPVGADHAFTHDPDRARVTVDFGGFGVSTLTSTGIATLPWRLASEASTINGTRAVAVDDQVWIQATAAGLPQPVTYTWRRDGVVMSGVNGTFYTTTFSTPGTRWFSVTMTGSNGQYVVRELPVTVAGGGGCIVCGGGGLP